MSGLRKIVRRALGESGTAAVRRVLNGMELAWLRFAVRSEFLCRLHFLFSREMSLETRSVLAGKVAFLDNRAGQEPMNYFLRRSVHRLEKGLAMPNGRPVFALDYIEQTVRTLAEAGKRGLDANEASWAHDVLEQYFSIVDDHPVIARARHMFEGLSRSARMNSDGERYIPFERARSPTVAVTADDFHALSLRRRSVRVFEPRPVPRESINRAGTMAGLSPSACNRQPIEFRVFDDPELVGKVARLPGGTVGFAEGIPTIVVLVGRLRAYPNVYDRHIIYIDGGLAAMTFMYGLETLGLSSCPINWPDVRSRELAMTETLGLTPDERVVMLIAVGYGAPSGLVPYSKKIGLEHLFAYNKAKGRLGEAPDTTRVSPVGS